MLTDGSSAGSQILLDSDLYENLYKTLHVLPMKNTLDCGDAILFTLPSPYASKDHLLLSSCYTWVSAVFVAFPSKCISAVVSNLLILSNNLFQYRHSLLNGWKVSPFGEGGG